MFLIDTEGRLAGTVPLGRLAVARPDVSVQTLAYKQTVQVGMDTKHDEIIELFDKYNLYALPVVDDDGRLQGVVKADDVIAYLSPEIERGL